MNNIDVLKLILKEPVETVIDGGAYLGTFTESILQVYPDAIVHAFEPNPFTFETLEKHYKSHARVKLNQVALGYSGGNQYLHLHSAAYTDSILPNSMCITDYVDPVLVKPEGYVLVPGTTLDDYCEHRAIQNIDLLKLDLQGFDYRALQGAKKMLSNTRMVLVEMIYVPLYEGQLKPRDIEFLLVHNYGFTLAAMGEGVYDSDGQPKWRDAVFGRQP